MSIFAKWMFALLSMSCRYKKGKGGQGGNLVTIPSIQNAWRNSDRTPFPIYDRNSYCILDWETKLEKQNITRRLFCAIWGQNISIPFIWAHELMHRISAIIACNHLISWLKHHMTKKASLHFHAKKITFFFQTNTFCFHRYAYMRNRIKFQKPKCDKTYGQRVIAIVCFIKKIVERLQIEK